jgi:hypothetical protein
VANAYDEIDTTLLIHPTLLADFLISMIFWKWPMVW